MKSKIVTTVHKDDELKQPSIAPCLECVINAESYYKRNRRFVATYVRLWQTVPRNMKSFERLHTKFFGSNKLFKFKYEIIDMWIAVKNISSFCVAVCGNDIPRLLRTGYMPNNPSNWVPNPPLNDNYYDWLGICAIYKEGRNKMCYLVVTHLDINDNASKLKEWCVVNDLSIKRENEPWIDIEKNGRPSVTYIITANRKGEL